VKTIDHRLGMGQQLATGIVKRDGHVGPVSPHLLALLGRQFFQAFSGRGLIAPFGHRQHLGLFRVRQIGEDGTVEFVPLLQTQLIDADIGNLPVRINLFSLGVRQLMADDQAHHFRRNAQTPSHLLFGAADQQPQYLALKPKGVRDIPALERRNEELPVIAPGTAMVGWSINPETGLSADV
jgi:hypothetical protein